MPEGHTLHRLARRQQRLFGGRRVRVTSPQGRFADGAAAVDGMTFHAAEAWGKHLLHRYRDGRTEQMVHIHLGLYGAFTELTAPLPEPVGQVRLRIETEDIGTDLRGPTACEIYHPADLDALIARLGPDPLRRDADPERGWAAISRSSRPIGALLMDQKVIAGIGNVYRAEVLFRAGIDPMRPGKRLLRSEFDDMWLDLVALMKVGVRRGRIHVIRPEDDHGAPAYAANRPRTYVYRRAGEPCRICGTPVLLAELEARKLYWCPVCQE
ncbi:Fpg/Nei family DNA glycosylase [Gordonia alkanivorans]|uniref:Fpg/Nei family DNA glycosylase n=1 Tax=Gordonia alkanivorans TaxID=84096 RepID=UPI00244B79B7|nr:DNA-formamidopyrimidine glycosylase family protein [Gordonia alkanivorans]MDH3006284.1 zinc finger domain-containing protein [Gordonia alkanivorans]MDH3042651.1 zinc finger domain-containing protein [Gordonia alkanivorans]